MTPKRIVVAVDFSYHSANALELAMPLANRWGADITALHVDPLPGFGVVAMEPVYIPPHFFEGLHSEHNSTIDTNLQDIRKQLDEGIFGSSVVNVMRRRHSPVEGIVNFAIEWDADLLVMGSQGTSGISHLLLGSTAEKVSRAATCPVLIAGRADDSGDTPREFRRVLAAIDYSEFSVPVAQLAMEFVVPGGIVELLHIWDHPYRSALSSTIQGASDRLVVATADAREQEAESLTEFRAALGSTLDDVIQYIGEGSPPAGILQRCEDSRADLIVLGAHNRKSVGEKLIGTVADRVLRHADVPVLLLPEAALAK